MLAQSPLEAREAHWCSSSGARRIPRLLDTILLHLGSRVGNLLSASGQTLTSSRDSLNAQKHLQTWPGTRREGLRGLFSSSVGDLKAPAHSWSQSPHRRGPDPEAPGTTEVLMAAGCGVLWKGKKVAATASQPEEAPTLSSSCSGLERRDAAELEQPSGGGESGGGLQDEPQPLAATLACNVISCVLAHWAPLSPPHNILTLWNSCIKWLVRFEISLQCQEVAGISIRLAPQVGLELPGPLLELLVTLRPGCEDRLPSLLSHL
ncbi:hypothetical protein Cadr_000009440 [Camelus dromedarius]|uniref:Uncharacterized protein n=1 Tax=Camelus dromedarius TaxID=9838 RepID=A0A5N4DI00_CAMDR|nr:hypothetical protein Cadr_000009440 [Camelus dromedarius]